MGADAVLTELGRSYTRIFLLFAPFFMVNYTFTAFARNDKAPTVAMIGSICGSLFNIVFDYVLMFVLNLGLAGAAMATACSPLVTMAVCATHYLGKKNGVGFRWVAPKFRFLKKSCGLGVSAFIGEMSSAVTTVVFNMLILHYAGNIGVAAYGIIANVSLVAMAIMNGIAQGTQPLLSESFGKSDRKQLDVLLRYGIVAMLVAEVLIVGAIWLGTDGLIAIFNTEHSMELYGYAFSGLRMYFSGLSDRGLKCDADHVFCSDEQTDADTDRFFAAWCDRDLAVCCLSGGTLRHDGNLVFAAGFGRDYVSGASGIVQKAKEADSIEERNREKRIDERIFVYIYSIQIFKFNVNTGMSSYIDIGRVF